MILNAKRKVVLSFALVTILILATIPSLSQYDRTYASGYSISISAQPTLTIGQDINLTGTICPSPYVLSTIDVSVNYTSASGQTLTFSETGSPYGQTDYCSNPLAFDTSTFFNSTDTWKVVISAQWLDGNNNQQSATSNVITFSVVQAMLSTSTSNQVSQTSSFVSNSTSPTSTASQNVTLNAGQVASIPVSITGPSYLAYYAVSSSSSIQEGVLTSDQYNSLRQNGGDLCTGTAASLSESCGQSVLNGLLMEPGSYYLAVYSPQNSAQVDYGYNASLSLSVVNATSYVGAFITLSPNTYENITVNDMTVGSPSTMQLFGISTQPISYKVTNVEKNNVVFSTPALTTTNLNGTLPNQNVTPYYFLNLPSSLYQVTITNQQSSQVNLYLEYQLTPQYVNPYTTVIAGQIGYLNPTLTAPMGVTSYGVYNQSGKVTPYLQPVMTKSISGYANIASIEGFDVCGIQCQLDNGATSITTPFPPTSNGLNTATDQLNGVLVVNNTDGSSFTYWVQNVIGLNTTNNMGELKDDIFNMSGDGATIVQVTNSTGGSPSGPPGQGWTPTTLFLTNPYTLPLQYKLFMTENVLQGKGVVVNMSDSLIKGFSATGLVSVDNITILDPNVQTAYFYITGTQYTPAGIQSLTGSYYDAENVLTGGSGAEVVNFTSLNAQLSISYWDSSSQSYSLFPSAYSFGGDTGESDANAYATYQGNGIISLSKGTPNWAYMYGAQAPTTTNTNLTTSSPGSASGTSSTASTTGPTSNSSLAVIATVIVVVIIALAGVFFLRSRRGKLPPPPPPPPTEPTAP